MFSLWLGVRPLIVREKCAYIGSDQQFTVYFGELYNLLIAPELVVEDNSNKKVLIFMDNKAVITFFEQSKRQLGQCLLQKIALQIKSLPHQLEIYKIPAHSGVSGNESAEIAAKEVRR